MGEIQISGDMLLVKLFVVQIIIIGVAWFFLRKALVSSTDGAVKRLNTETEAVHVKQADLDKRLKEADEELAKRKKEAEELTKKMVEEADTAARAEREKIIKKARDDGEEIIARAQTTKDKMKGEIEKALTLKMVDFSAEILSVVLSERAKGALNQQLIEEFIENLQKLDLNQVGAEVDIADVITAASIDNGIQNRIGKVIKDKLKREIKINSIVDQNVVGGVVLRFGSLALDGSLQNIVRETATAIKEKKEGDL